MRILLSASDFTNATNGLARSARDFSAGLRARGHEVRVISYGDSSHVDYPLQRLSIPFFDRYISAEDFNIARPDRSIFEAALRWAQILYVEDPLPANAQLVRMARHLEVPIVGSFHVYPENFLAPFPALNKPIFNRILYSLFDYSVYSYCDAIHAPTEAVKERLQAAGYQSPISAFSNGLPSASIRTEKSINREAVKVTDSRSRNARDASSRFTLVSTGRLVPEKNHQVLLQALAYSRHSDNIDLYLAGSGPLERDLHKLAAPLAAQIHIGFIPHNEVIALLDRADIYVHCALVEIEGLAALEAMARGCMPIIARSEQSSTWRYSLDRRNVFNALNPRQLAALIDYWLEHPLQRTELSNRYNSLAHRLDMRHSIDAIEGLLLQTLRNYRKK
ncbi:glycosyltransferase [Actinomyces sp.]